MPTREAAVRAVSRFGADESRKPVEVSIDDITELRTLGISVMGSEERSFPSEVLERWLTKNSEVVQAVRFEDRIVGYAIILPLVDETLVEVLEGTIRPRNIPLASIQSFGPIASSLYVAEMVVDQQLERRERSVAAAALLRRWGRFFAEKRAKGFRSKGLWCIAITPKGISLVRRLGGEEVVIEGVSSPTRVTMQITKGDETTAPLFPPYRMRAGGAR